MRTTPDESTTRLVALATLYLRPPSVAYTEDGVPVLEFTPPLTAPEQVIATRIRALARSAVQITPAEWQSIEADIAGLTTYQNLPTPTLAQTILAVKAQSRILRAILRD